jgi:hypothetical protein
MEVIAALQEINHFPYRIYNTSNETLNRLSSQELSRKYLEKLSQRIFLSPAATTTTDREIDR